LSELRLYLIGVLMVEKQRSDEESLIDQTLSLLQSAMAETKTDSPPVRSVRAAELTDLASSIPLQEQRTASLIGHALSLVKNVAGFAPRAAKDAPSSLEPALVKQIPEDVPPSATPAQEEPAGSLIDHALSLVTAAAEPMIANARSPSVKAAEEGSSSLQQPVEKPAAPDVALSSKAPFQDELELPSVGGRTVSIVAAAEAASPPRSDAKQDPKYVLPPESVVEDERTTSPLDQAESVDGTEPKALEAASPSPPRQFPVKQLTPKERLDIDRADIRRRVATFKEHQERFQREREEYYTETMAKTRASQWTPETRTPEN
jgi:hypothetical protein